MNIFNIFNIRDQISIYLDFKTWDISNANKIYFLLFFFYFQIFVQNHVLNKFLEPLICLGNLLATQIAINYTFQF